MTALAHSGAPRCVRAALVLTWLACAACEESHTEADAAVDAGHTDAGHTQSVDDRNKPDAADVGHSDPPAVPPGQPPADKPKPVTQGFVRFTPRLEGDLIVVDVESTIDLSTLTCGGGVLLQKHEADAWVAPHDDRHPFYQNPGYYLDGEFVPFSENLGCDEQACIPFPQSDDRVVVGPAYEYFKTGTKAPPPGSDGSPDQVDVIETRALSGVVLITLKYFDDGTCEKESGIAMELTIPTPEEGLCCPIGDAQCSSEGPGGGWAPNLDACKPWSVEYDAMFVKENDPRGCPKLVGDYDVCCGCEPEDGGI